MFPPLQGIARCCLGRTPVPHNIQHGRGRHHWVTVVATMEVGMEGIGISVKDLEAYFYADNGLITSNQPERLKSSFDVTVDLFDPAGLQKNIWKMVSME